MAKVELRRSHRGRGLRAGLCCDRTRSAHVYVEADLATKERAREKLAPRLSVPARYRADDKPVIRRGKRTLLWSAPLGYTGL
jgi:hypothetical protein